MHLNKADISCFGFDELFILWRDAIWMHAGAGEKLNFPLGRHLWDPPGTWRKSYQNDGSYFVFWSNYFFFGFFCGLESAGNFFAYVAYDSLVESRDHAVTLIYILLSLRTPILSQQVLRSKSHISRKSINKAHSEGVVNTILSSITNKNEKT